MPSVRRMKVVIKELITRIHQVESVVLVTHVKPDGDALGSLFGLADVLQQMDKSVCCYFEEEIPILFHFLCFLLQIRSAEELFHRAERGAIFENFAIILSE